MALFTLILEYGGGTYASQVNAVDQCSAVSAWRESFLHEVQLEDLPIPDAEQMSDELVEGEPAPLRGLENVWCTSGIGEEGLGLLNIVKTDPRPA